MSNLQCKIKGRYALPHLSSTRLKFWKLILLSFKRVPSNVCYPLKHNGTDRSLRVVAALVFCSPAISCGREGLGRAHPSSEDEGAGTHPQVGARDGVWSDRFPLLRAFLLDAQAVACDRSGPLVQWGLPRQHQGGGPHFKRPHAIRGSFGKTG